MFTVQFKVMATIVYRSLNGTAPRYLAADLRHLSDMPSKRRLRSSLTDQLDVRQTPCSTVGDRSFAVAGARLDGTVCHLILLRATHCHGSAVNSKHFYYPRDAMPARVIEIATCLSVRLSVRLSVTRRYCVKTKKASGMISSPSGSPKTLVF